MAFEKILQPTLEDLMRFVARPKRSVVEPLKRRQTVKNPKRREFPGIYRSPREIVDASAQQIVPESPLLKQLFGVTREDIDALAKARYASGDDLNQMPIFKPPQGGPKHAFDLRAPSNTNRVQDVINLAATDPRYAGNYGWYENQPLLDAYIAEWGVDEGTKRWDRFHQIGAGFSPGSDVPAEIRRATAADKMAYGGEGARFLDMLGNSQWTKQGKPEGMRLPPGLGHVYHSSNHQKVRPILEGTGDVVFDPQGAPKTGQYYGARVHRNMEVPIGDAHYGRGLGLADVRPTPSKVKIKDKDGKWTGEYKLTAGGSPGAGEFYPIQEWYRDKVAGPIGVPAVPAQALQWNAMAESTGVESPIGAPLMEIISRAIGRRAEKLGVSPETVRDNWIGGKERLMGVGGVPLAGSLGFDSEERLLGAYQGATTGAVDQAIEPNRWTPMPAQSMPATNPVAGDLASAAESVTSPAGAVDPQSLAQYLRDIEYGRQSSIPTLLGASMDITDPLAIGSMLGEYFRR